MRLCILITFFSMITYSQTQQGTHSSDVFKALEGQLATLNKVSNPTSRFYNHLHKLVFDIGSCSEINLFEDISPKNRRIDQVLAQSIDNLCDYLAHYGNENSLFSIDFEKGCVAGQSDCSKDKLKSASTVFMDELSKNKYMMDQLKRLFGSNEMIKCNIEGESSYETFLHTLSAFTDFEINVENTHYLYPYLHDHQANINRYRQILKIEESQ